MTTRLSLLLVVLNIALLLGWPTRTIDAAATTHAEADLRNAAGKVIGHARLDETPNGVHLTVTTSGLSPGVHGFHVHETGSCGGPDFTAAGGHFNPEHKAHGMDSAGGTHAGDLPNIHVEKTDAMNVEAFLYGVTLAPGPKSLFDADGSALIIHAGRDDYHSQPAGDAGARLACGVIKRSGN